MNVLVLFPALIVAIIFQLTSLYRRFHQSHADKTLAKHLKCQPPLIIFDPFGISQVLSLRAHMAQGRLWHYFRSQYALHGRFTLPLSFLGKSGFVTADPENLQALLVTQAKSVFLPPATPPLTLGQTSVPARAANTYSTSSAAAA